jgi:hypothetical protein
MLLLRIEILAKAVLTGRDQQIRVFTYEKD